jgi:diadenosine tetraphosphatase ApaH/serine/threonine PP2A family protein phosphatase
MDKEIFLVHQGPTKPLSSYLQKFGGAVDVVVSSDGAPWAHPAATKIVFNELYTPSNYNTDKSNNSTEYQTAATKAQR